MEWGTRNLDRKEDSLYCKIHRPWYLFFWLDLYKQIVERLNAITGRIPEICLTYYRNISQHSQLFNLIMLNNSHHEVLARSQSSLS